MLALHRHRELTGVLDGLSEVALGGLLHLSNNESADLTRAVLLAARLQPRIAVSVLDDFERDVVEILLNLSVGELATDETLGGEESVLGDQTPSLAIVRPLTLRPGPDLPQS
jgi:hypothetical protein